MRILQSSIYKSNAAWRIISGLIFLVVILPSLAVSQIDPLSLSSYYIDIIKENTKISNATGFVIENNDRYYLVTNWHVVTGKHPTTKKPIIRKPDMLRIYLPAKSTQKNLLIWTKHTEPLYGKDSIQLWYEHPSRSNVDVVLLPLTNLDDKINITPINLEPENEDVLMQVGMSITIIGFPNGLAASGKLPVWKVGHFASEPYVNYNNSPTILIDARTIGGMSGSPVILRASRYLSKSTYSHTIKMVSQFVGVYSGRLPIAIEDKATRSDLGLIWKPIVIHEILASIKTSDTSEE